MTGKIGPHEGLEFELYENGEKDLIYFSFDFQPEGHIARAESLGAMVLKFDDQKFEKPNYIYYRPGSESRAKEALRHTSIWIPVV